MKKASVVCGTLVDFYISFTLKKLKWKNEEHSFLVDDVNRI